ncbi:hypothetical protein MW887_000569 [Aspergillus wentii]|nr:hypothetical protein MW887_000569 [Aspergillus wentii]
MASSSTSSVVQFSEGENDLPALQDAMDGLLEQGWEVDGEGRGLKKTYYFKSYFKAVSFVNVIASESAVKKHHPTMTIRIGSVDVHWTTHQPRGLSSKDINMAQHCEKGAELMSAVVKEEGKKCK